MKSLIKKIESLPRRIEPIGGQRCSYLALDDVVAVIEQEYTGNREELAEESAMLNFILAHHGYVQKCTEGHWHYYTANENPIGSGDTPRQAVKSAMEKIV